MAEHHGLSPTYLELARPIYTPVQDKSVTDRGVQPRSRASYSSVGSSTVGEKCALIVLKNLWLGKIGYMRCLGIWGSRDTGHLIESTFETRRVRPKLMCQVTLELAS